MKNLLLILFLLPAMANAQFSKGDVYLGGTIRGSYRKTTGTENDPNVLVQKNRSINISPITGFFLSDRFAMGAKLEIGLSKDETESAYFTRANTRNYVVGAVGRYFFPVNEKFMFALTGGVSYLRARVESQYYDNQAEVRKLYSLSLNINPTFLYFPSKHWGFEANIGSFGYGHLQDLSTGAKNDSFQAAFGSISLGVAYYIRK